MQRRFDSPRPLQRECGDGRINQKPPRFLDAVFWLNEPEGSLHSTALAVAIAAENAAVGAIRLQGRLERQLGDRNAAFRARQV